MIIHIMSTNETSPVGHKAGDCSFDFEDNKRLQLKKTNYLKNLPGLRIFNDVDAKPMERLCTPPF